MTDLVINNAVEQVIVAGANDVVDVNITNNNIVIERADDVTLETIEVSVSLKRDDVYFDVISPVIEVIEVAQQGPMGPAGPAGSGGSGDVLQNIFEPLNQDSAYRGDSILGTLTSTAAWIIVKISIQEDGSALEQFADGNNESVHVWDDRALYTYA